MPLECLRSVEARPKGVFDDASSGRTVFRRFFGPCCADGFEEPVSENMYVLSPNYRISPFSSLNELRVSSVVLKHLLGPEKAVPNKFEGLKRQASSTHAELQE